MYYNRLPKEVIWYILYYCTILNIVYYNRLPKKVIWYILYYCTILNIVYYNRLHKKVIWYMLYYCKIFCIYSTIAYYPRRWSGIYCTTAEYRIYRTTADYPRWTGICCTAAEYTGRKTWEKSVLKTTKIVYYICYQVSVLTGNILTSTGYNLPSLTTIEYLSYTLLMHC